MKRITLTVTALILVLALCACSGDGRSGTTPALRNTTYQTLKGIDKRAYAVYTIYMHQREVVEIAIIVSLQSDIPAYEQIKVQIKAQILSGELAADEPLISMRQLARDLRVSVITTTRAYGDLEAEGLIYTVQGRGCYVKGNADLVREQYLRTVDISLQTAADKGLAAGLSLAELQHKLEEMYNAQRD